MIKVFIEVHGFIENEKSRVLLSSLLSKKRDDVCTYGLLDLTQSLNFDETCFRFDNIVTTYGEATNKADIFVFKNLTSMNLRKLAGLISKKNIYTVSVLPSNYVYSKFIDLVIDNSFNLSWDLILEKFNYSRKYLYVKKRKKHLVAFITPYNFEYSSIARYSRHTLKELCKKIDIDVYSLENHVNDKLNVRSFNKICSFPYLSNKYDHVISVLGDSPYHNRMTEYHINYGGSCIMHDSSIKHYLHELMGQRYILNLIRQYSKKKMSAKEYLLWLEDRLDINISGNETAISASKNFFVHSKKAFRLLSNKGFNVKYLPFCVHSSLRDKLMNSKYKSVMKKKLGYKKNDILITSFGSVSDNKMSLEVLLSYIKLSKIKINRLNFAFVGGFACDDNFKNKFIKLLASNKIRFYDKFLDENLYNSYLYATDIAVQLRRTTSGQVSGAISDNIFAKIPTVSCEDLTESIEAPSYIYGLKGKITVDTILSRLILMIERKEYLNNFENEKRKYLEVHNFNNYTNILLENLYNQQ